MKGVANVFRDSQQRTTSPDGGYELVFNRAADAHLGSKRHQHAELNQARLDWVIGIPSLPPPRDARPVPEWTRSLRGRRTFQNGLNEHGNGMPGAICKDRIADYWGASFENFALKAWKRISSVDEIKCSQGNSKQYAVKTKFIASCTPAIVEYYL